MAGIVWWLLDVSDLYSKFVAPQLPEDWVMWLQPYAVYLNVATPWVVAAIVIWAVLYTYYEVEKQVTRDPGIPRNLREFYVQSVPYSRFDLQSEDEFPEWKNKTNAWYKETVDWITENMSEAAVSRFTDTYTNTIRVKNSAAVNDEHDNLVNSVNKIRSNLKDLIENEAWDVKDKKE